MIFRTTYGEKIKHSAESLAIVKELIQKKFIIKKKAHKKKKANFELNLMLSRMFQSSKYKELENKIIEFTSWLPAEALMRFRIKFIFHNMNDYPKCKTCSIKLNSFITSPLASTDPLTCSVTCAYHYTDTIRGKGFRARGHKMSAYVKSRLAEGRKNTGCTQKGKTKEEFFGIERAREIKMKCSQNATTNTGFYHSSRKVKIHPVLRKKIIFMSRWEEQFFDICIDFKYSIDSCRQRFPYLHPIKNLVMFYHPDFELRINGQLWIIEIKPEGAIQDRDIEYNKITRAKLAWLYARSLKENFKIMVITNRELGYTLGAGSKDSEKHEFRVRKIKELFTKLESNLEIYLTKKEIKLLLKKAGKEKYENPENYETKKLA